MDSLFYSKQLTIVISSPSGAGKTSVCKEIIAKDRSIKMSISCTTRKPRDNEVEGMDYKFLSYYEFKNKIENNEFLEYAKVFDNYYGSSIKDVKQILNNGCDVLFDIDWQGAKQISEKKIANLVKIFICPPSKEIVQQRLKKRSLETGDDAKAIEKRMSEYEREMRHQNNYNYVLVNDNLLSCVSHIEKIIEKERNKLRNISD